jgi:AraC-like DNA-binding protein
MRALPEAAGHPDRRRRAGVQWQDSRADPAHGPDVVPSRNPSTDPRRVAWDIERVKIAVAEELGRRAPDIALVAERLRTSSRTLQRRLRGAGLSYAELVGGVRRRMAERLLQDPARKVADVARAVGYSDPSHFTRAFSRWTGVTPRSFRKERRRACGGAPGSAPPGRR